MKFERTPQFDADVRRLSKEEFKVFREFVLKKFLPACDRFAVEPTGKWPASMRIKSIAGAGGILEVTWSFSGPDGRATFEMVTVDGEPRIRWRRVGGHDIFQSP